MRVMILGATGMLGHRLITGLGAPFEVHGTCRGPVVAALPAERLIPGTDATDRAQLAEVLDRVRPEAVVNAIGVIKQRPEAEDPVEAIRVNALFPHELARACRQRGIRLIHFGTDCVFSGRQGRYRLGDPCDAEDLYGRSKALGEVGGEGCLTLRSSFVGLELASGFGLVEWFLSRAGSEVPGYTRAVFSGLTTGAMTRVVAALLLEHPGLSGVWQVAAAPISKHDLLASLDRELGLGTRLRPDEAFFCDRSLDGSAFEAATGIVVPSWEAMVHELAHEVRARGGRRLHA